jgi:hypothetical protein
MSAKNKESLFEDSDIDARDLTKINLSSSTTNDISTGSPVDQADQHKHGKSNRARVAFQAEDPIDNKLGNPKQSESLTVAKKANLTIRLEDEARIIGSIHDAGKKITTGSIFSILVDISKTGTLDIGVKDLNDNVLAVSLLKRENDKPGAGEAAGKPLSDYL